MVSIVCSVSQVVDAILSLERHIESGYGAESRNRIERFIARVSTAAAHGTFIKQVVAATYSSTPFELV